MIFEACVVALYCFCNMFMNYFYCKGYLFWLVDLFFIYFIYIYIYIFGSKGLRGISCACWFHGLFKYLLLLF
jgi:hypothetical protein